MSFSTDESSVEKLTINMNYLLCILQCINIIYFWLQHTHVQEEYIPYMSLPYNLKRISSWSRKFQLYLENYDFFWICEIWSNFVKIWYFVNKYSIKVPQILLHICETWLWLGRIKKQSCFSSGGFSKFNEGGREGGIFFFFFFFFFASERSRSTHLSCRCWLHIQLLSFMLNVIHTCVCFRAYICTNTCLNIFRVKKILQKGKWHLNFWTF